MTKQVEMPALIGQTFVSVRQEEIDDHDALVFDTGTGIKYIMAHEQECCEYVSIEDICGELEWLCGSPVLDAYESRSSGKKDDDVDRDSYTWTFYSITTAKGYVTIRWYGESNSYYAEDATLHMVDKQGEEWFRKMGNFCIA
jgi:hypothetical protein